MRRVTILALLMLAISNVNAHAQTQCGDLQATVDNILQATTVTITWPKMEGMLIVSRTAPLGNNFVREFQANKANQVCAALGFSGAVSSETQVSDPKPGEEEATVLKIVEGNFVKFKVSEVSSWFDPGCSKPSSCGPARRATMYTHQPYEIFKVLKCRR